MKRKAQSPIWILMAGLVFTGAARGQTSNAVPPQMVAVLAGRLFDGTTDHLVENQVILIDGERIAEVGPRDRVKVPSGAKIIDLSHATVLPGLIDAHTHMLLSPGDAHHLYSDQFLKESWQFRTIHAVVNARLDLQAGFTSARDLGTDGAMYSDVDLRNAINGE